MNILLNEDIYKNIISTSSVEMIESLSLVSKMFYNICINHNMWLEIFKRKNLEIWGENIVNVNDYINEYNKMSYAKYTRDCLFHVEEFFESGQHIILKNKYKNVNKIKDPNFPKLDIVTKSIYENEEKIEILRFYFKFDTDSEDFQTKLWCTPSVNGDGYKNKISLEKLGIILLKLLYYYSNANIYDYNHYPVIIDKRCADFFEKFMEGYRDYDGQSEVIDRKIYWDECYKVYHKIYF